MNPESDFARRPSRRRLLVMAGGAAVGLAAARLLAGPAQAAPEEARRLLERLTQGKAKPGRIRLGVAEIVEN
ncbi:MAG: sulfur oxidation protein SoxY, partial [Alphaproteobacteria bacterium]|nr:sulfur oxidation protein SoxY [Alphaproteobacteria bacterium]